jgi:Domain of unknown function (DUF4345)
MRLALRIILLVGGIAAVLIALLHIVFGSASIPGSVPVNATMDSEDRFYAAIFLGFGAAILWCAQSIEQRGKVIRFLIAIFFLEGCARVISMIFVGPSNQLFQALMAVELLLPPVVWFLLNRVERLEHR